MHYPGSGGAAAPGRRFPARRADFLKVYQKETVKRRTWYEKKLWHWYDCTDYAANLYNCPVVAYSSINDSQKQAADMMEVAMKREGLTLQHLIGGKFGHAYDPAVKKELVSKIDRLASHGKESTPIHVKFTTYTLRYNESFWVFDGLWVQHWERAGRSMRSLEGFDKIVVMTKNVNGLTLEFMRGDAMFGTTKKTVSVAGSGRRQILEGPQPVKSDKSWVCHLEKRNDKWKVVEKVSDDLRKRHGLQGPIDDAFMSIFLIVKPTGKASNEKVGKWVDAEMNRAIVQWRGQFRGEPRVKNDADISDADIAAHNLVLWGDPSSNAILAKIKDNCCLRSRGATREIKVGSETFSTDEHAVILIYPNPLNPKRYVVLNSGFTFREYDYLNNARQVAKLPDYAIVDLRMPPSKRFPGAISTAGFFDDAWKLTRKDKPID